MAVPTPNASGPVSTNPAGLAGNPGGGKAAEKQGPAKPLVAAQKPTDKGGIQYAATVVVPVQGTAVTGAVDSQSLSVEGPKVLGVKLPGVSLDNPLGSLFGGSPKPTATSANQ